MIDVSRLIEAGELAEKLSTGRRKKIMLMLSARGIRVKGHFFDQRGHELLAEFSIEVPWPQIIDSEVALVETIKRVEAEVDHGWRTLGGK